MPGQDEPALRGARRSGNVRVVELLLDAGAPIDKQNDLHETALRLAAEEDSRFAVLELLLRCGADASLHR